MEEEIITRKSKVVPILNQAPSREDLWVGYLTMLLVSRLYGVRLEDDWLDDALSPGVPTEIRTEHIPSRALPLDELVR
jgi:hypothetical protein